MYVLSGWVFLYCGKCLEYGHVCAMGNEVVDATQDQLNKKKHWVVKTCSVASEKLEHVDNNAST